MRAVFVETHRFTVDVTAMLSDDEYADLQQELMSHPDAGAVMPGCGGMRKMRCSVKRAARGKRGGARVIYLYVPASDTFFMIRMYGKSEMDDLKPDERRELRRLSDSLRTESSNR
jgi:hypothetical protein